MKTLMNLMIMSIMTFHISAQQIKSKLQRMSDDDYKSICDAELRSLSACANCDDISNLTFENQYGDSLLGVLHLGMMEMLNASQGSILHSSEFNLYIQYMQRKEEENSVLLNETHSVNMISRKNSQ